MDLPFVPMLLERTPRPVSDEGWIVQVKWDGVRNLTLVEGGRIWHWSRRVRDRTALFPELDGLAKVFGSKRVVLDGELVMLRGGRPSFAGILERDAAGLVSPERARRNPATLMLFDLLEYDGSPLYGRPLEERLDLLARIVPPAAHWQVVQSFPGTSGPDLFAAVGKENLEGIVAKRRGSLYAPGTRSKDWLKTKRKQRTLAVVCGYTAPAGRPGGLLLGAYREGQLRFIGRVGAGLTSEQLQLIRQHLPPADRPFAYEPQLRGRFSGSPGPVVWTEPRLTIEVEFSEWTEDAKLRDPVVTGFSTQPPEAAQIP